jgi:hypothetical protein
MSTTAAATTAVAQTVAARRPSRKVATIVSLIAVPAALAASGLVVAQSSYSAYSATTVNPTNNWATGTVALSDDDNNTAAFSASNLKPGSTGSRCIVVSSTGTLPASVKLYGTGAATTNALASNIVLTITQGTGGSAAGGCAGFTALPTGSGVYSGTLSDFGSTATSFASGAGTWNTAGVPSGSPAETRTYQLTYAVKADAPNSTQGGTAAIGFTWEAQNS